MAPAILPAPRNANFISGTYAALDRRGQAAFEFARGRLAGYKLPIMHKIAFAALIVPALLAMAGCAGTSQDGPNSTGEARRAYYNTPGYQDQQPFAYNEPIADGFYDSGYEESLYSPFSFN